MLKSLSITAKDLARNNRLLRSGGSLFKLAKDRARNGSSADNAVLLREIDALCSAARLAGSSQLMRAIEARIDEKMARLDLSSIDYPSFVEKLDEKHIYKAVLLKPYLSPREKGVIFMSADYEWMRLLRLPDVKDFASRYTLVLSPGWSPPHCLIHYVWPAVYPEPFFSLISNVKDLEHFIRISPQHLMVPLFASSWVNPARFTPRPRAERDIDLIMVANFGAFKRHHALFRAMRDMPKHLKIVLIGQDHIGRTDAHIHAEAKAFGVDGRFELVRNAKHAEVAGWLARAKASTILSVREGSCVVVAESMFADTPVGLLHDAEIGSKAFINAATGRTLLHQDLGRQLTELIESSDRYRARDWAVANISCQRSTHILNEYVRSYALGQGQSWSRDLSVHHWAPDPQHLTDAERADAAPGYDEIKSRYGLTLGKIV